MDAFISYFLTLKLSAVGARDGGRPRILPTMDPVSSTTFFGRMMMGSTGSISGNGVSAPTPITVKPSPEPALQIAAFMARSMSFTSCLRFFAFNSKSVKGHVLDVLVLTSHDLQFLGLLLPPCTDFLTSFLMAFTRASI